MVQENVVTLPTRRRVTDRESPVPECDVSFRRTGADRRLAAVLCADVVGYSRLTGADEEYALGLLIMARKTLTQAIEKYRGRVCNCVGDAVLAEFPCATAAVKCAVDVQTDFAVRNLNVQKDRQLWLRIGINLGDVIVECGEIYGNGVNIAARLESLAPAGGICISGGVHDAIGAKLKGDFQDMGKRRVKNIVHPIRAFRLEVARPWRPSFLQSAWAELAVLFGELNYRRKRCCNL